MTEDLTHEIRDHLDGFKERRVQTDQFRRQTDKYHRENTKRLDQIEKHQRDREVAAEANHEELKDILGDQNRDLEELKSDLKETKMQAKMTNGRVSKLEKTMLIVGTATAVTIILKFPEVGALLHLGV